jgi:hypothetical protein
MMSTRQVFLRVVVYGLVLSAVDAVSGRMFRAAPDLSTFLSLGGTAWVAYRLAAGGLARVAIPAALVLFAMYLAGYLLWSTLLIGWNGAVAWRPPSTRWLVGFVAMAPIIATAAYLLGLKVRNERFKAHDGGRTAAGA